MLPGCVHCWSVNQLIMYFVHFPISPLLKQFYLLVCKSSLSLLDIASILSYFDPFLLNASVLSLTRNQIIFMLLPLSLSLSLPTSLCSSSSLPLSLLPSPLFALEMMCMCVFSVLVLDVLPYVKATFSPDFFPSLYSSTFKI